MYNKIFLLAISLTASYSFAQSDVLSPFGNAPLCERIQDNAIVRIRMPGCTEKMRSKDGNTVTFSYSTPIDKATGLPDNSVMIQGSFSVYDMKQTLSIHKKDGLVDRFSMAYGESVDPKKVPEVWTYDMGLVDNPGQTRPIYGVVRQSITQMTGNKKSTFVVFDRDLCKEYQRNSARLDWDLLEKCKTGLEKFENPAMRVAASLKNGAKFGVIDSSLPGGPKTVVREANFGHVKDLFDALDMCKRMMPFNPPASKPVPPTEEMEKARPEGHS